MKALLVLLIGLLFIGYSPPIQAETQSFEITQTIDVSDVLINESFSIINIQVDFKAKSEKLSIAGNTEALSNPGKPNITKDCFITDKKTSKLNDYLFILRRKQSYTIDDKHYLISYGLRNLVCRYFNYNKLINTKAKHLISYELVKA